MTYVKASVLLPITKERGPLLPYSVGSILQQTVKDIEVLIIGDGADSATREVIHELQKMDDRIRFFDFPKGIRRGEVYRHEVLTQNANGKIICYLLDRDLMLPDHVEKMIHNLENHNFCVHASISVKEDHSHFLLRKYLVGENLENEKNKFFHGGSLYFSPVGHTLEIYKKLPYGWRTTPGHLFTTHYMWQQFMAHPEIKIKSTLDMTILYFKRGDHPGWLAEKRAKELKKYYPIIQDSNFMTKIKNEVLENLVNENEKLLSSNLLIRGKGISHLPDKIMHELSKLIKKRW